MATQKWESHPKSQVEILHPFHKTFKSLYYIGKLTIELKPSKIWQL